MCKKDECKSSKGEESENGEERGGMRGGISDSSLRARFLDERKYLNE